jgi:hypothetical protein
MVSWLYGFILKVLTISTYFITIHIVHYDDKNNIETGMGRLRVNKYVFSITMFVVYTLIGFVPSFRVKLAPLVEMSKYKGKLYYFFENFTHNWGFKITITFIVAAILSVLISKIRRIKN